MLTQTAPTLIALAEAATPAGAILPPPSAHMLPHVEAIVRGQFGEPGLGVYRRLVQLLDAAAIPGHGRRLSALPLDARCAFLERLSQGSTAGFWLTRAVTAPLKAARARDPALAAHLGLREEALGLVSERPRWARQIVDARSLPDGETLEVDCVVVGTGAGGAPMAKALAQRGHAVLMLEEGGHFGRTDFQGDAFARQARLFRDGGSTIAWGNGGIPVPMGRTVGGTTTINSGTCYRVPPRVQQRWVDENGLTALGPGSLDPWFERVEAMLQVERATPETLGGCARVIARGAEALGFAHEPLMRNAPACDGQGMCCFGCPTDAKRGTNVSYVPAALQHGAMVYCHARVTRVLVERGRAVGVVAETRGEDGLPRRLTVRASAVVMSGGTLGTPALLLQQGLCNSSGQVGRQMSLHPACYAWAAFDEPIRGWEAIPQGYAIEEFAAQGLRFEGAFLPVDMAAAAMGQVGPAWTDLVERFDRLACFGFMVTDTSRGRVLLDPWGKPRLTYWLNDADRRQMIRGHAILARVYLAAGARVVHPGLRLFDRIDDEAGVRRLEAEAPERLRAHHIDISAYHPLGSCRMGADPRRAVVGPTHETHDLPHLFVCDGSTVPGPLGVNPQMTIMAMSERAAQFVERRVEQAQAVARPPASGRLLAFDETMAGPMTLHAGARAGQRIHASFRVHASAPATSRTLLRARGTTFELDGTVSLPGVVLGAICAGTLELRPLRRRGTMIYDLRFTDAEGGSLHLHGEKHTESLGVLRGMTTLHSEVLDADGQRVASGWLRFDLLGTPAFLKTWKIVDHAS